MNEAFVMGLLVLAIEAFFGKEKQKPPKYDSYLVDI